MDLAETGKAGRAFALASLFIWIAGSVAALVLVRRGPDLASVRMMGDIGVVLAFVPAWFLARFALGLAGRATSRPVAYAAAAAALGAPLIRLVDSFVGLAPLGFAATALGALVAVWALAAALEGRTHGLWGREAVAAAGLAAAGAAVTIAATALSVGRESGPDIGDIIALGAVGGWLLLGLPVFGWIAGDGLARAAARTST